jgi:type IX secretion system PorP/SprF family membrane protein
MENKETMKNKLVVCIAFLLLTVGLRAQQAVQYTQYMYTPSLINPAYVGLSDVLRVSLLHKSQWVGIPGAPGSQTLLVSSPLTKRVGIGFGITRDQIGPANETNASLDLSYLLQLNNSGLNLSFGMKGGVQLLNVDFTRLTTQNPNDNALNSINNRFTPNMGAGVYVYNTDWYVGFSSPNLLSTKHYNNEAVSVVSTVQQLYFMGGVNFNINSNLKFKPAFLVKSVKNAPLAIDMSLNFLFKDRFTTGISYRYNAAISGLMQVKLNKSFSIGYAYDYDTTDISYFSGGSHEVILIFDFYELIGAKKPSWIY